MVSGSIGKLKIGLVLDDSLDSTDGVQQYVLTIGHWLKSKGHQVFYLSGQSKRSDLENLYSLSRNVNVRFNGNKFSIPLPVSQKSLNEVVHGLGLDVLHVQMPYSPFMAGKLVKAADNKTAVIGTFHVAPYGRMAIYGARVLGKLSSGSISRFDRILAVSEPAAAMARDVYGVRPKVLGNAFDYKKFANTKPVLKDKALKLIFLGRLVKRKGCKTLLEALALLERSNSDLPDYRLIIAGTGRLRSELEYYAHSEGLAEKVDFVGFVEEQDKPLLYASSNIAVFPSISGESFGYVLIEAMANGHTAVIAADNPGYASLLEDDDSMLFKAGDFVSLAKNLKRLMFEDELRLRLAHKGQALAKKYDVEVIGTELIENYTEALRKHRR